jgi:hypothetical protein
MLLSAADPPSDTIGAGGNVGKWTHGTIFFGFAWDKEATIPEVLRSWRKEDDFETWLGKLLGFTPPPDPPGELSEADARRYIAGDPAFDAYAAKADEYHAKWAQYQDARDAAIEAMRVKFDAHGHDHRAEWMGLQVAIPESIIRVSPSEPEPVDISNTPAEWRMRLRAELAKLGVKPDELPEPRWWSTVYSNWMID